MNNSHARAVTHCDGECLQTRSNLICFPHRQCSMCSGAYVELSGSLEFAVELWLAHLPGTLCQTFQIMTTVFRYLLRIVVILTLLRYSENTLFSTESGVVESELQHGSSRKQSKHDPGSLRLPRSNQKKSSLLLLREQHLRNAAGVPAPGEAKLEHINISAVLVYWTYPFEDVPSPIQFVVQSSINSLDNYKDVSGLLNTTRYVYSDLLLETYYMFRVVAYHNGMASPPGDPSYFFINGESAPPGPPVNLKARASSYNQIELLWEQPQPPLSVQLTYHVYYGTDPQILVDETLVIGETHRTFTNLHPDTTYYFRMRSDLSGYVSVLSDTVNATTNVAYLPPVTINTTTASPRWVWLSWGNPPADRYPLVINNFTVHYAKQSQLPSPIQNVTVGPEQHEANVTGLDPGTDYVFRVSYRVREFTSDLSDPRTVSTPDSVTCYQCSPCSPTELQIRWRTSSQSAEVRTFDIFEVVGGQQQEIAAVNASVSGGEYSITGLHPWSGHTFVVALDNGSGHANQSDQCPIMDCWTLEAAPSEPPAGISVTQVSSRTITLEWGPPPPNAQNGIITKYTLIYECSSQGSWQSCITKQIVVPANSSNMHYTIASLMPFTRYLFELTADNHAGRGPPSFPVSQRTLEEAPSGPPKNITVLSVTEQSILLTWDPPTAADQNGIVTGYVVSFSEVSATGERLRSSIGHFDSAADLDASLEQSSVRKSVEENVSVVTTEAEISGLKPSTHYMVFVAARTQAGVGPNSDPLTAVTLVSVVHRTVDLNFSIEVITFTNSCFSVVFSWVQPSDMQVILETVLNNVTVTAMNYSIQYASPSPRYQNGTIMLNTNISEYELSAEETLMPSTNYSFWLHVDVDLSNGTYGHLESLRLDVVTPSCSGKNHSHPSGSHVWRTAVVAVCTVGGAIVLVILVVCLILCIYRLRKRRESRPYVMFMDNYPPQLLEENEYVDLRRSDGQSSVGSDNEESRSPSPGSSSRSSDNGVDSESLDSFIDEQSVLLEQDSLRMLHSRVPSGPRENPDGCSISSSGSESQES